MHAKRTLIAAAIAAVALMAAGSAAAAEYIGAELTDVKPEDKAVVAHPQPVQLLFQFETKGAPNAQATKFLKQQVIDTVKASGLFTDVTDQPTANGALLSIVIDNVVAPKDIQNAEGKGVVTGATLFIAGSNITDHYQCTVDYVSGPTAAKLERTAHHSVVTQMGLINKPPADAVKIGSMKDAVLMMVRQIVANPLNDIGKDPAFEGGASPPAQPTPTPAVAPPVASPVSVAQPPPTPAGQPPAAPPTPPVSSPAAQP